MNTMNRIAGFILLASITGFAFGAANGDETPKRTVNYADLDLSRKAGRKRSCPGSGSRRTPCASRNWASNSPCARTISAVSTRRWVRAD